jgi:hypothetical protein
MNITTKSDLENLILNQIEENIGLDYKSAESLGKSVGKKKELSKDVSAFANSNGGIIIYGIKEFDELEKRHLPEKIDPVNRTEYSKEWLEQVINSNISPRIDGINITSISLNETDEVAYLVDIPKSYTAHQSSDFRYYKRFNFESVAMHDYEVKDVMNRNKTPKIELIFELEKFTYEVKPAIGQMSFPINQDVKEQKKYSTINTLNIFGKNIGGVFADYVNCFIEVPVSILNEKEYEYRDTFLNNGIEYKRLFCDNTIREIKDVENYGSFTNNKYWPSRYDPILPETRLRFDEIKLKRDIVFENEEIFWEVYADNSAKRKGSILMSEIKTNEKKQKE